MNHASSPTAILFRRALAAMGVSEEPSMTARPYKPGGRHLALLSAARTLVAPFTISELIVRCFKRRPDLFAMKEYPEYPDAYRIKAHLFHTSGPVRRGEIVKVGKDQFCLSEEGRVRSEANSEAAVPGVD